MDRTIVTYSTFLFICLFSICNRVARTDKAASKGQLGQFTSQKDLDAQGSDGSSSESSYSYTTSAFADSSITPMHSMIASVFASETAITLSSRTSTDSSVVKRSLHFVDTSIRSAANVSVSPSPGSISERNSQSMNSVMPSASRSYDSISMTVSYSSEQSSLQEESSTTTSAYPSTIVPVHWKTVTVCPWDTLYTGGLVLSSVPMSSLQTESLSMMTSSVMSSMLNMSSSPEPVPLSSFVPSPSWVSVPPASFSVVANQSDILPIAKKGCNVVLGGLAKVMGDMTSCLLENLRPIEVCGKCTKFHSLLRQYETLIHSTTNCDKELILDYNAQYQAVTKMYKAQYGMWQDFECEKCYKDRADTDPKAPWIPKEEFLRSQKLVKDIMVCFANYSQSEIPLPYPVMLNVSDNVNGTSWKLGNKMCTECKSLYTKLKKYMKSIHFEGSAEKRWCADMVYGFNETRRIWGQFCITKQQDEDSLIALTCFFCFIPVIFYVGTKLHSDVKERKNESRVSYESD